MYCNNCGNNNDSESRFCTSCGKSLNKVGSAQARGSVDMYFTNQDQILLQEANKIADGEIKNGFISVVIGLGITFITWLFASDGGTYYVFWGLVFYGGYVILKGIYHKVNPNALISKVNKIQEEENKK